jgi:uncharacterized membrane protein YjjB (DUF3815 family)
MDMFNYSFVVIVFVVKPLLFQFPSYISVELILNQVENKFFHDLNKKNIQMSLMLFCVRTISFGLFLAKFCCT